MTNQNVSTSQNLSLRERPVRWPNEIHDESARQTMRMFVILADGRPVTIERQDYTSLLPSLYDSPEHIAEWEKRFAARTTARKSK